MLSSILSPSHSLIFTINKDTIWVVTSHFDFLLLPLVYFSYGSVGSFQLTLLSFLQFRLDWFNFVWSQLTCFHFSVNTSVLPPPIHSSHGEALSSNFKVHCPVWDYLSSLLMLLCQNIIWTWWYSARRMVKLCFFSTTHGLGFIQ
jgi:hypothetical protein